MSSVPLTGRAFSRSFLTRKVQVLSMPFLMATGLAPEVTACAHQADQVSDSCI